MIDIEGQGIDEGLLDGAGKSRRFVRIKDKEDTRKLRNNPSKKRISFALKYGKKEGRYPSHQPLKLSEQLRISEGATQAIVKVTSYGKSLPGIMKHLLYISRDFELPLEDQDGAVLTSKNDMKLLLDSWKSIYFDNRKNARDTVHLVFSAPPGSNRQDFKKLTREFLHQEFEGEHDYLFVPHDDTEHPHIHSVICLRSIQGKKLDPRKKYLHELRKSFAAKCREYGIHVDASRRFERGLSGKSVKSEFVQIRRKRQMLPEVDKRLIERIQNNPAAFKNVDTGQAIRIKRNECMREQFYQAAKSLYESQKLILDAEQKTRHVLAAKQLLDYSQSMPREITRAERLMKELKGFYERTIGPNRSDQKEKSEDVGF